MDDNSPIIFIVGNSRSGTTMLGRVFGNHTLVHTFGELHFFEMLVNAETVSNRLPWPEERRIALLERLLTTSRVGFFTKVVQGQYRETAVSILKATKGEDPVSAYKAFLYFETTRNSKVIPCEQTPRYLFFIKEILQAFPEAFFINIIRDPRDVLLSQKNKWRRRFLGAKNIPMIEAFRAWANYHPYTVSQLWLSAVRTAKRFEHTPRFISIQFETLLNQPKSTVQSLCEFTGLVFESEMINVPQVGSSTGFDEPVKKGIDRKHIGKWRKGGLSLFETAICQHITAEEMALFNYELEPVSLSKWNIPLSTVSLIFKTALSFLLNLNRTRNLKETIQRRLGGG